MNGVNAAAPSPTTASNAPGATGSGTTSPNTTSGALSSRTSGGEAKALAMCFGVVAFTVMYIL